MSISREELYVRDMRTLVSVLICGLLSLSHSSTPKRPNIVMIIADDLGYQDVGFRGSNIRTPNIDRLAREGVILENHYVMSVCAPTRASLMTGRHAIRTGFWKGNLNTVEKFGLGLDETLLPEMLKRNGYSTHGVGKWHCGAYSWEHTPAKRGFDTFFGLFLGGQYYFSHRESVNEWLDFRENYHDAKGNFIDDIRDDLDGLYNTYLFTNKSVELIRNHDKTRPLFLECRIPISHVINIGIDVSSLLQKWAVNEGNPSNSSFQKRTFTSSQRKIAALAGKSYTVIRCEY